MRFGQVIRFPSNTGNALLTYPLLPIEFAMFSFFGLFADPVSGLSERICGVWPGLNVIRIKQPISAIGVRFEADVYEPELEEIPEPITRAVEDLSAEYSGARFLLLRTECNGGTCANWGQVMQSGKIAFRTKGNGALRRVIKYWGMDLGPEEVFDPLRRDYPWDPREPTEPRC